MKLQTLLIAFAAVGGVGAMAAVSSTESVGAHSSPNAPLRRLSDLSHTIEHGMVTYKGLPAPVIGDHLSREQSRANYAEGTELQIGRISMVANTGTCLDAPSHRFADGKDLSDLDPARRSWELIPSTSTIPPTSGGRSTRHCLAQGFRSSNTSGVSTSCP